MHIEIFSQKQIDLTIFKNKFSMFVYSYIGVAYIQRDSRWNILTDAAF